MCVHFLDKKGTPFNTPSSLLPPQLNIYKRASNQSQSSPTTFLQVSQEVELPPYKKRLLKAVESGVQRLQNLYDVLLYRQFQLKIDNTTHHVQYKKNPALFLPVCH